MESLIVYGEKESIGHLDVLDKVKDIFPEAKVVSVRDLVGELFEEVKLVVTVGGDGTFIRTANFVKDQMIVGVNSEYDLSEGALLSVDGRDLSFLKDILAGKYHVKNKDRIQVRINGDLIRNTALNEVYFGAINQFHTSRYLINFKNASEEQRSSGVIVATCSGSHAWYKSALGIPFNTSGILRFLVREPYFGNNVFKPKLVHGELKYNEELVFECLRHDGGVVAFDANLSVTLKYGDKVKVEISSNKLKVLCRHL